MFYQPQYSLRPEEVLLYSRKSRTDNPLMPVEDVLANHEKILNEMAERHLGGLVPEENRFREIVSGETIDDRPEVKKVLKLVEKPKYKAIMIVEVQRLSRGDLEDAGRLIKLLRYTNTLVITQFKIYNLQDEYDRDAFERELKRGNEYLEYQKKIMGRGRLLSVSQGNYIGSIPPYGYNKKTVYDGKKKCPTLEINDYEAAAIRLVFDLYVNQNKGIWVIARELDKRGFPPQNSSTWAQDSIRDILQNPVYIGKIRWNFRKTVHVVEDGEIIEKRLRRNQTHEYELFEGKHDPIISEELFEAAQLKVAQGSPRTRGPLALRNPLAGLVFCKCGRAMIYRQHHKDGVEISPPRLLCNKQHYCQTASCTFSEVMSEVEKSLRNCIADFEIKLKNDDVEARKQHENLIVQMQHRLKALEEKEVWQWDMYSEKKMPKLVFDKLNAEVLEEKEKVSQAICEAQEIIPSPVDYQEKITRFQTALDAIDDPGVSIERKNELLKACIERITYSREKSRPMTKEIAAELGVATAKGKWVQQPISLRIDLRL